MIKNTDKNISDDNIFSELSKDIDTSIEDTKIKDGTYYIKLISSIIWYTNLLLLFLIATIFWYNYLQNNDYSFKSKIVVENCDLLLWEKASLLNWECTTVSNAILDYTEKSEKLNKETLEKLNEILPKLVKIEKLLFSDNIAFLVQKSQTKLEPLKILAEFDKIKNSFILWSEYAAKDRIECKNIEIKNNILTANCNAYSSSRNTDIIWFSWNENENIIWTSASIAASFLNYIDKNSEKLKNIEKQKVFKSENTTEKVWLFKKTNFKIKLQYIPNSNLSL